MPALHSQGPEEVRLSPLTAHHTDTPSPFSRYRLVMPTKSVQWSVEWSAVDDSQLLVGVYEHGIGNWDAIKGDSKLGLGAKVTASGGARAVFLLQRHRSQLVVLQTIFTDYVVGPLTQAPSQPLADTCGVPLAAVAEGVCCG